MALPEHILVVEDPTRLFSLVSSLMDQYAESQSGVAFDPDAWEAALAPLDFQLTMIDHFLGTWEGSGSFVNEARGWWDEQERIKKSLVAFGCEQTAEMFDEAAELGMQIATRYDSDQDITPEQAERREQLNQLANEDVSCVKLASFIREHQHEFLR